MKEQTLRNYAKLIVRSGINVVPQQMVVIRTAPVQLKFVEMLAEECYEAGASRVHVEWEYQPLKKLAIKYQSLETLSEVAKWQEEKMKYACEKLPAMIYLSSEDPDGLKGIDAGKWAAAQQASYKIMKPYSDEMDNKYQWCIAAVPGREWAAKVFPGLSEAEAEEKLWEQILFCSRADGPNPIEAWEEHNRELHRRCSWLNSLKLRRLIYKSESTGTDFTVGLIPQMNFCGGSDMLPNRGVMYNANIPSEEVYTSPMKGDADGIVYATKPLSYRGSLIENFSVRFEKGRVTEVKAEKNQETLEIMVKMDEGASMLGECALVPWGSPIQASGVLFYNTLFDENAACHLALGRGFTECLENCENYTLEEARALGVNDSMIHEDFMIGSADLNIWGICENGEKVRIFENGHWAEN